MGGPRPGCARPVALRIPLCGAGEGPGVGLLTALRHTDVRVGVEQDVAVGAEATLCQPPARRALAPARRPGQSKEECSGHGGGLGSLRKSRVGEGHPEIWGLGSRTLCGSPPGSPQTLQAGLGGLLSPPSYPVPVCWAHLELQDLGCTGPHGLYTLVGGQVRSADTRTGVRWAKEAGAPRGHTRLTTQPAGGVAPVGAHAPGAAERRVGLQALAERFRAARPAAVADTGAEEQARRDEAVAPGEHPAGRAGQRPRRCPGGG